MSLPLAFGTELATVPASIPYLVADAELRADWAQRLGTRTRPRIGLVWDGGRHPPGRDVPLDMLRVLLELDAEFISLQKDLGEGDAGYLEEFGIAHQGELLEDFADTAALIENLDLVITVDTATAHLAGALGKPVWVLLKYAADWRWLLERTDSPWYPSARLFRQASAGDWFGVVRNLRHAAASFLREQQVGSRPVAFEADIRRGIALLNVGGDIDRAARLHRSGRSDAALRLIDQVLAVRPDLPEALLVRAVALAKGGRHADALATTERLLAVSPDATEALCIRGHALRALARPREALECFDRALAIEPDRVNALALRSFVYAELGRVDAALASMDRALALAPSDADTLELKASLLQRLGRRREALECQERVIAAEPRRANALKNRGLLKLSLGQLAEGFRDLEQRWNTAEFEPDQLRTHAPPWTGSEGIAGKTILLHHEQGFGDSLQFARYVPLVAARGARVMLRVPGALARLMQTLGPGVCVIIQPDPGVAQSEPLPPHDFHCSLLSLPAAFGTTLASIPAQIPYLHAHPERAAYWRAKLGPKVRPRVGLAWAGRQVPPIVERRDVPLEALQPLLALDAEFISLQRELAQADRQALQSLPVRLLGEWLEDFADAAALIQHLDLVISVDTAVLHLAGALGKPVWLMNRFAPCWRWLEDRSDSPWYPTLRLFGQKVSGDWAGVVDEVKHAAAPFLKTCCASDVGASAAPQAKFSALMGEGLFRFEQGEVAAALDCFSRALHQVPGDGGALINRASALARLGRFEEALECFAQVPPDHPGYPIVLLNRANALRQLARYAEALEQLERLLPMRPDDVQVLHDLGFTLARMWRFGEALAFLDRALAANPTYTAAYVTRAFVLDALERDEEAAADLKRALVLEPGRLDALNNYGDALLKLSRAEEALEVFRRAVQLAPEDFGARHNCWTAVDKLGRHAEALQMCEQFLAEHPANAEARLDRAICLLSDGRLREGFADFEARWETSPCREARLATGAPRWLGDAPLGGKTLLLYREQGLGDAIQFVRFVSLVAARGARVVLRVPAVLKTFMESMHCLSATGTAQLVVEGEPLPPHDYQCPLMSLPLAFDTDLNTVPAQVPYLHADPRRVEQWAMRLSGTSRLRVGLAWSGRLTPPVIPRRDIPLRMLAPLLELDADFISLQKEMRPADREFLATLPMLRHGETLEDFADTAALIENLDLVICVDTSVAHVAGAIGKPVWIMNRSDGCWRWLRERGDSPWYPTARLFRQPTLGDWAPAVEEVRRWLRDAIESKRQRKATNEASDDGSARSLKRPLLIA
jgi:tetratricopeptide (TPR) repeat protein